MLYYCDNGTAQQKSFQAREEAHANLAVLLPSAKV